MTYNPIPSTPVILILFLTIRIFYSSSLFTNSNWFAFEDDKAVNDRSTDSIASPSTNSEDTDEVVVGESEDLVDRTSSETSNSARKFSETTIVMGNGSVDESKEDTRHFSPMIIDSDKSPEWVEWRETTDSSDLCCTNSTDNVPNGDIEVKEFDEKDDNDLGVGIPPEGETNISNQEGERSSGLASKTLAVTNDLNLAICSAKSPELASGCPNLLPSVSGSAVEDLEHEKVIEGDK